MKDFEKKIEYIFNDQKLLLEALTHPSLSKAREEKFNYQRLEFLGDKVLSLVITDFLIIKYKEESEGDLSKRHSALVCGEALSVIAKELDIGNFLKLSKGEESIGGKSNKRNLENSLEAIIGAIYLDSGYENAKSFILRNWKSFLEGGESPPKDPITELQEIAQAKSGKLPSYNTIKTGGSDHSPIFTSTLKMEFLDKEFTSNGNSKKIAQKEVAKIALGFINKDLS